jgi:putative hydrolase of the HAD superfamily
MSIRTVFFDLDDTLCKTSSTRLARARLAFDLLTSEGHDLDWDAFWDGILRVDPGSSFIRGLGPVIEEMGIAGTPLGRAAVGLWFFDGCDHLIEPFDAAAETLARLSRELTLGVITNGPTEIQSRKFRALRFESHFKPELFITSEIAGCYKPEAAIFHHALAAAGFDAHEAVLIGDQPAIDVEGAQRAGMRGVWFNPEGKPAPDGISPDATVRSFAELPSLLEDWTR